MYHINSMIGKTVTIRSIKGDEYIATLTGVDPDQGLITVTEPRVVVVDDNNVLLYPFALTAECTTVTLLCQEIFAILETLPAAAEDYQAVVAESVAQRAANITNSAPESQG